MSRHSTAAPGRIHVDDECGRWWFDPAAAQRWSSDITWDGQQETLYLLPNGLWVRPWRHEGNWPDGAPEVVECVSEDRAWSWLLDHGLKVPAELRDTERARDLARRPAPEPRPDPLPRIAENLQRLADAQAPDEGRLVGTEHIAKKLGITTQWVVQQIKKDPALRRCVLPGSGNGKPWKLDRHAVDRWLARRR
jgi:hypothetical protein